MTEVPEHLLRRARERRAAATGEASGDAAAPAGEPSTAVESAAAASPAPAGGASGTPVAAGAPAAPAYTGPPAAPPQRNRVPIWALPVLVALPLWAVLYSGAFGERKVAAEGLAVKGQTVYASAGCSGCHGPAGGGGVGPALANVTKTFPTFADHVAWVESGSAPFKGKPYGATGKVATGGMPSFKAALSHADIVAVVCHERVDYGKQTPPPPECAASGDATTTASK